jgi:two-component system response regulator MprA
VSERILIVEDEANIASFVSMYLQKAGYSVDRAATGGEGLEKAKSSSPSLIVLDLNLPDMDGLEVCRRLRAAGNRVPVLVLTARDAVSDRIDGLDAGADDYLVKPFDVGELKARLRALLRRVEPEGPGSGLAFAELELEADRHGVSVGESFTELTRTEYQLLELLMRNPRRVLPHDVIYDRVWGYDFGPASNALRVYVGYLRRKLEQAGSRPLIHTVRGVGYALREP